MLLFGCQDGPANSADDVWNCRMQSPCKFSDVVLYGWGRNAPPVTLPAGSGYTVGTRSSNRHLVLQIHFLDLRPKDDESGLRLKLSTKSLQKSVSLQAFARGFMIPPGRPSYPVKNDCCYNSAFPMTSFASRVHTHGLGRRVSLDITTPSNVVNHLVVDSDPLQPQGFYPTNKTHVIRAGDRMEMTCDFDSSNETEEVYAGHTADHEMCNLYLMSSSAVASFSMCVTGSHMIKKGQGLGTNIVPRLDTLLWDTSSHHVSKGFGQIPGLFYSSFYPESVWMFYRRDSDWTTRTFGADNTMSKDGFVRGDTISLVDLRTGEVKMSFGSDLFMMPHMISEAEDGSLWVTDVGAHLVHKLSPETGKVLATLGGGPMHAPNSPGSDETHFCKPTEAIETRDGRILVADGYCNNRVVEFDAKTLKLVKEYDLALAVPSQYKNLQTTLPHSLAYDECTKMVTVALRVPQMVVELDLNAGVEQFTSRQYDLRAFGQPMAMRIGMHGARYALTMGEDDTHLVELDTDGREKAGIARSWKLPGPSFAHDFVFVPGPEYADGTIERNISFIVSETKQTPGSQTFKYVFHDASLSFEDPPSATVHDVYSNPSGQSSSPSEDAAIHINTDDPIVSTASSINNKADSIDVGHSLTPTMERSSNVFMFSLALSIVVLWGFLQTLGMTMRSMNTGK